MGLQDIGAAHVEYPHTSTRQSLTSASLDSIHGRAQAPVPPSPELEDVCDDLVESRYEDIIEVVESLSTTRVKGRLRDHIGFWATIKAPQFILDIIADGYKLPLVHTPPRSFSKNNLSAIKSGDFVQETIEELLASDRIVDQPQEKLHVVNPLSVSIQSSGKKRLILDLRFVNQHILKKRVKFEDSKKALEYFCLGGYASKFGLKSGYHHIDIFPPHQSFLGFSWTFPDGSTRFFAYTVLPFGLSSAPYIFTKLLRPLVKHW